MHGHPIAGPGAAGTLMTFAPDPRKRAEAKAVVEKFRAKGFEPEAYTLYAYAAVQIIKQAAEAIKSLDTRKVAAEINSGRVFKTVLGDLKYDKKGEKVMPLCMHGVPEHHYTVCAGAAGHGWRSQALEARDAGAITIQLDDGDYAGECQDFETSRFGASQ